MHIRGARGPLSKRELRAVYHQIWYHAGVIRKELVWFALGAIREKGTSLDHIPYSWLELSLIKEIMLASGFLTGDYNQVCTK